MNAITKPEQKSPVQEFRGQFDKMSGEIAAALPPHIPVERFMRVVLTAVNSNPDLLRADRRSLFEAAMKAAQDGLLPDGRDGAFVMFKDKAQWMPMVGGILKKVRNSGELLTISAQVAYEKDRFVYVLGDDEKIEHEPHMDGDRGKPRLAYAIARTKDGGIYREIMTVSEIEKVRAVSRAAKNGPWVSWWEEMAKKTVIRRLAKRLPMSSDLDDLIRRDDELYDFNKNAGAQQAERMFGPMAERLSLAGKGPEGFDPAFVEAETNDAPHQESAASGQQGVADEAAAADDLPEDDFPGDKPSRRSRAAKQSDDRGEPL
ncbi:MAG: recombinase RecT [Beijerinckiaceae bacterium]